MKTTKLAAAALLTLAIAFGSGTYPAAQGSDQGVGQKPPDRLGTLPVRVEVLLTRFQGEKKVSSLPFSLLASAIDPREGRTPVSIRMGVDVPIGTQTTTENQTTPTGGTNSATRSVGTTKTNVQYRSVGTDIDCSVNRLDETRYTVRVNVSDSSVYSADGDTSKALRTADPAAFRTFSTGNSVVMRDGQTVLFGVGTDKISGETLKVEVALHVVK